MKVLTAKYNFDVGYGHILTTGHIITSILYRTCEMTPPVCNADKYFASMTILTVDIQETAECGL